MRPAIELFGSPWCSPCGKAKEIILASNPQSKGVAYSYVDVSEDAEYASRSLPVIFVGDDLLEGFDEQKLRAALDRLYASVSPKPQQVPPVPPPSPEPYSAPPSASSIGFAEVVTIVSFAALGFAVTRMTWPD